MSIQKNKQPNKNENNRPDKSSEEHMKIPHNHAQTPKLSREHMKDAEIENPDQSENPGKDVDINDNPDETKRKIPNA